MDEKKSTLTQMHSYKAYYLLLNEKTLLPSLMTNELSMKKKSAVSKKSNCTKNAEYAF